MKINVNTGWQSCVVALIKEVEALQERVASLETIKADTNPTPKGAAKKAVQVVVEAPEAIEEKDVQE